MIPVVSTVLILVLVPAVRRRQAPATIQMLRTMLLSCVCVRMMFEDMPIQSD